MKRILAAAALAVFILWAHAAVAAEFTVRFGIMEMGENGEGFVRTQTRRIPFKTKETGFRFGYELEARTGKLHEHSAVLTLPTEPGAASGVNDTVDGTQVKTAATEFRGTMTSSIWFDRGDPLGEWILDIYVDGEKIKTIPFNVVEPD